MGFIYKITNKLNGKSYIGKTESTVDKRWKQHLADHKRDRCKNRPLYRAMSLYGINNFSISILEETENTIEREIYWIDYYNTYSSGYNATKGGDGKCYVDIDLILKLNNAGLIISEIKELTGYDVCTILKYLNKNSLIPNSRLPKTTKKVRCIELDVIFDSQHAAADWIKPNSSTNEKSSIANKISLCCRKIRKSAYNYTWQYV